jgi:ectoine hydroxylase-related dioxygenase (phytanoyl-CoA dioxygenase family)
MNIEDYALLKNFHKENILNKLDKRLLSKLKKNNLEESCKVIISLSLMNIDWVKGYKIFTSNRYFVDCLKVKLFPKISEIKFCLNVLKYHFLTYNEISLKNRIKKIYKDYLKKIKNKFIPKIFNKSEFVKIDKKKINSFEKNGYLIIENVLSNKISDYLNLKCRKIAIKENNKKKSFIYGSGKLQRIYHLINKDKIFQDLIIHPTIIQFCEYAFKRDTFHQKYFLSSWHCNILKPGAESQKMHVDAAVPEPLPPWIIRLNVNFITQDYTKKNGATLCVPGSHKFLKFPNDRNLKNHNLVALEAPKNSIIFWHGHLWHQSGTNNSNNDRVALLGCFASSFLRELSMEENPYLSLYKFKNNFSDKLKEIIGWSHGVKN